VTPPEALCGTKLVILGREKGGTRLMPQTVLILDDEPDNVLLIQETLRRNMPDVDTIGFTSPRQAVTWCASNEPDLCLVDYKMVEMSGIEFIRRVRANASFQSVPIIMITGQPGSELQYSALDCGATDFLSKPLNVADMLLRTRNHLRLRSSLRNQRLDLVGELEREMKGSAQRFVEQEQTIIIQGLLRLSGYRDEETGNHMRRMAQISGLIAEELGADNRFREMILLAAPMHDIGKVGIPDRILLKPGKLDPTEWTTMKTHTTIGYDLLKAANSELMRLGAEIAHTHHERFDGAGYPQGMSGEAIPLSGRIVAVSDVFDALVNTRHYKKAWPLNDALDLMRAESGKHFDPACVASMLRRLDEVMDIQKQYADNVVHTGDPLAARSASRIS
jgi:response regulator RpfG family c-di-GMP phosphodiesterase